MFVDALIGYGLKDAPRETIAEMIDAMNESPSDVVALDLPSGVDADTGKSPGAAVVPKVTLTLALPKPGLLGDDTGDLWLADLGIPRGVLQRVGVKSSARVFEEDSVVHLRRELS